MGMNAAAWAAPAVAMVAVQGWKVIAPVFRGRRPRPGAFLKAGGMPSGHSATVVALATSVGLRSGFGSDAFAIAAVLTAVVLHDAVKVRGALQALVAVVRRTAPPEVVDEAGGLPESVGHDALEVAAGILVGILIGWGSFRLLG